MRPSASAFAPASSSFCARFASGRTMARGLVDESRGCCCANVETQSSKHRASDTAWRRSGRVMDGWLGALLFYARKWERGAALRWRGRARKLEFVVANYFQL